MCIHGIGLVFSGGRGLDALARALHRGWVPPSFPPTPGRSASLPAYRVPPDALDDPPTATRVRRADRFCRLATIAAVDAFRPAESLIVDRSRVGLVLATAFGPHATTFRFLDDILDYGDRNPSPTAFSHSVHNAAASYVALLLGLRGPTVTVTHFHFAVHEALRIAHAWLKQRRCDWVLVNATDECSPVMEDLFVRLLPLARDGRIRPFAFDRRPESVPGEGSVCFLLSRASADPSGITIATESPGERPAAHAFRPDLVLLDAAGLIPDASEYRRLAALSAAVSCYTPIFGGLPIVAAFHAAVAWLMLHTQHVYACPDPGPSPTLPIVTRSESRAMQRIACHTLDCYSRCRSLWLSRGTHDPS